MFSNSMQNPEIVSMKKNNLMNSAGLFFAFLNLSVPDTDRLAV